MKERIKVLFVCWGNICRSTMAESVMTYLVKEAGLGACIEINSAATSREEIGNPPHPGTVNKLREMRIPLVPHCATQMTKEDYSYYDYLIGMDSINISYMKNIAGGDPEGKIYKLLTIAGISRDVADPWYTGNFQETYEDVLVGCEALLKLLVEKHFS